MKLRIKIYHTLVNRIPAIQKEYHRIRIEKPGMSGRIYAWLMLLWMNLCWLLGSRKLEEEIYHPAKGVRCHEHNMNKINYIVR